MQHRASISVRPPTKCNPALPRAGTKTPHDLSPVRTLSTAHLADVLLLFRSDCWHLAEFNQPHGAAGRARRINPSTPGQIAAPAGLRRRATPRSSQITGSHCFAQSPAIRTPPQQLRLVPENKNGRRVAASIDAIFAAKAEASARSLFATGSGYKRPRVPRCDPRPVLLSRLEWRQVAAGPR